MPEKQSSACGLVTFVTWECSSNHWGGCLDRNKAARHDYNIEQLYDIVGEFSCSVFVTNSYKYIAYICNHIWLQATDSLLIIFKCFITF